MNTEVIKKVEAKYSNKNVPNIQVGDTVTVHTVIRDGGKTRIQKFTGIIIAMQGKSMSQTFTVRKISNGVGVEKIFPLYSTNIDKIEIDKHANVKRSKLYFLRDRIGKAAMKLKPGAVVAPEENHVEPEAVEEVAPATEDAEAAEQPTEEAPVEVVAEIK